MIIENPQPIQNSNETSKVIYQDLTSLDKVKAILAAVQEPVSQAFALELAGIKLEELPEQEKTEIQKLFIQGMESSDEIVVSSKDGTPLYQASDAAKSAIEQRTDMKTVHGIIADKLMSNLGLDF
jgi:hypothetical protein